MLETSDSRVACALISLGTAETEQLASQLVTGAGHRLIGVERLSTDPARLKGVLVAGLADPRIQAVLVIGLDESSGLVDVVQGLMEHRLEGFQQLYRFLTFQEVGSSAIFSRACAGYTRGRVLACLPGGPEAVARALNRLLLPELGELQQRARG